MAVKHIDVVLFWAREPDSDQARCTSPGTLTKRRILIPVWGDENEL